MMLTVSAQACRYISVLLAQQNQHAAFRLLVDNVVDGSGLRYRFCFCFPDSFLPSDVVLQYEEISVRMGQSIVVFFRDAVIDYEKFGLVYQLTLSTPYVRTELVMHSGFIVEKKEVYSYNGDDCSLVQGVKGVIDDKINPQLSLHGGGVSLVGVTKDFLVVLKFFGGCNGCAMSRRTMRLGIEVVLKKNFPQVQGVRDVTEHLHGSHSYY